MKSERFKTGERIPASGVYRVHHQEHRLPHEVTLLEGYEFPRCQKCRAAVLFESLALAPLRLTTQPSAIVLYELPELPEDSVSDEVA